MTFLVSLYILRTPRGQGSSSFQVNVSEARKKLTLKNPPVAGTEPNLEETDVEES